MEGTPGPHAAAAGRMTGDAPCPFPTPIFANFGTLLCAAEQGDLALVECLDAMTGEARYVLCAVGREGRDYLLTPFGHLHDGNPFEAYVPPPGVSMRPSGPFPG